jgi:hypothetical protein
MKSAEKSINYNKKQAYKITFCVSGQIYIRENFY